MSKINKPLLRLAVAIRAVLASRRCQRAIELPQSSWQCCTDLVRQIRRAEMRGWHLAAHELRTDLGYAVPTLQNDLTALVSRLPRITSAEQVTLASPGDIYQDLVALEDEFDELQFDVRERWISVVTEPITLQGVYLGPFEIRLDWNHAAQEAAYRVIAKDPHPPECRENVTHPHVMDEILCEGHSRQAIRQSITQARLLDFFTLVANGLRTYNDESPFVELAIWYGATCSDCGAVVDEDDRYTCQRCEETICAGCETSCSDCGDSCCCECVTTCEVCQENYCRGCIKSCKDCQQAVCLDCLATVAMEPELAIGRTLAHQLLDYPPGFVVQCSMLRDLQNRRIQTLTVYEERCLTCHEKERQATDTSNGPAIQPHGVGQALVPA